MPCLYAYDRRVLRELLLSNREMLRGYPTSPRAFIELIYHVFFSAGDLHDLINLAFGCVRQGLLYAGPSTWAWQQKGASPHPPTFTASLPEEHQRRAVALHGQSESDIVDTFPA